MNGKTLPLAVERRTLFRLYLFPKMGLSLLLPGITQTLSYKITVHLQHTTV